MIITSAFNNNNKGSTIQGIPSYQVPIYYIVSLEPEGH